MVIPWVSGFRAQTHEEIDAQNLRGDHQSALCHPAVMMRRQVVLDVGKYREQFRFCEDLDLWLRLAEHGRLANLPLVLLKYRTHKTNQSNLRVARAAEDFQQILTEARFRRGLPIDQLPRDLMLRMGQCPRVFTINGDGKP